MSRRLFLQLLCLPFVWRLGRLAQGLRSRLCPPLWFVTFDIENSAPLVVRIDGEQVPAFTIAYPEHGRRFVHVPMWTPRPALVRITFGSAGAPFRLYASQISAAR
jgi:hypothetical protein